MSAVRRAVAAHHQTFIAFDFGLRRTGWASGNRLLGQAQGRGVISTSGEQRWGEVAACIAQWQPDALVVGVPYHPDGAAHENTTRALRFARQLRGRFHKPVFEVDERYTTTEARALAPDALEALDAQAARLILEQFFAELATHEHR